MANLQRYTQKIFGSASTELGQFGSAIDNTKVISSNVETLQALQAYLDGWSKAIITNKNYPTWQEMDGVLYGITYQQAYLFQNGIPEYDDGTEYKQTSIVKESGTYKLYGSLINNNTNNPLTDTNSWQFLVDLSDITFNPYTKFAINKGSTSLLIDNSTSLDFDVDNTKPLTFTNIMGNTQTVESLDSIDVSGESDGTYKVVLPESGSQPYLFDGSIFIQEDEPTTQVTDDVWINPQELYTAKQYDGADWQDFNDVILLDSSVTVASGVITTLGQPRYNSNHIVSNRAEITNIATLDWANAESMSTSLVNETVFIAPDNGAMYLMGVVSGSNSVLGLYLSEGGATASTTPYYLACYAPSGSGSYVLVFVEKGKHYTLRNINISTTGVYTHYGVTFIPYKGVSDNVYM